MYDPEFYMTNRLEKYFADNPHTTMLVDKFSSTRNVSHMVVELDKYLKPNTNSNLIAALTSAVPIDLVGVEVNHVLSNKYHNLDPQTLRYENPKLAL